jgi:uncharacterized delta-60 repeat protein
MRNAILLALVFSLGATADVRADGMLDPSFGNGGLVATDFPDPPFPPGFSADGARAVLMLPDGRAVAAGAVGDVDGHDIGAARYLASGALDTTFGGDGLVAVGGCPTFGEGGGASAAMLQPDGRLVLVGECAGGFFLTVARLNVDGSLDPSFGTAGQVLTSFPPDLFSAAAGILQPDGRIVAVGRSGFSAPFVALKAARYNPDGSLDPSFGTGGTLTLPLAQSFFVQDAVLQADGKLLIAGTYGPLAGGPDDFGLVRLLPNGSLDTSFDGDGLVTSDFGAEEEGHSVIVLGDGRIVLGGRRASDLALVRYLPDGSLDRTFGTGGLATADSGTNEFAGQLIVLPNGKLQVGGYTANAQGNAVDFLLARFHADGSLDTSFGSSGFIQTDFDAGSIDGSSAVAVAGPDLILAAGFTVTLPALGDFGLARYIASTPVALLEFVVE